MLFGIDKHKCLGYVISAKGVSMDPDKFQAMLDHASPQNRKELERFSGLLRVKNKLWDWSEKCEESFQMLKQRLMSPEVLPFPDLSKPFQNICDYSGTGIGPSLNQLQNGEFRSIGYASRKLKELLCVMEFRKVETL